MTAGPNLLFQNLVANDRGSPELAPATFGGGGIYQDEREYAFAVKDT